MRIIGLQKDSFYALFCTVGNIFILYVGLLAPHVFKMFQRVNDCRTVSATCRRLTKVTSMRLFCGFWSQGHFHILTRRNWGGRGACSGEICEQENIIQWSTRALSKDVQLSLLYLLRIGFQKTNLHAVCRLRACLQRFLRSRTIRPTNGCRYENWYFTANAPLSQRKSLLWSEQCIRFEDGV